MEGIVNKNYVNPRADKFVGVQKVGGGRKLICYLVRVPAGKGGLGVTYKKCQNRKQAEAAWMQWEGWFRFGGVAAWMTEEGGVPFEDKSYVRPSEIRRRKE